MNKKAIQLIEKMIEEDDYQTVSCFGPKCFYKNHF